VQAPAVREPEHVRDGRHGVHDHDHGAELPAAERRALARVFGEAERAEAPVDLMLAVMTATSFIARFVARESCTAPSVMSNPRTTSPMNTTCDAVRRAAARLAG